MFLTVIEILCIAAVACLLIIAAISKRENHILTVTTYQVEDARILTPCTFVMLADLHNATFGEQNEELLARILSLHPDAVLIAGDVIIGKAGVETETAVRFLNQLGTQVPVYISKGNHELRVERAPEQYKTMWSDLYDRTKNTVRWLINETVSLDAYHVTITGLDMDAAYYRRFRLREMPGSYLVKTLPAVSPETFTVLLAHNPDYFPAYAEWGADLTLSGHVHGGMVILPGIGGVVSPMVRLFPKYYRGMYEIGDKKMILTGGLGGHTFKIRVNNKPEICLIQLKKKE